jgi:hypothetical protein
MAAPPIKRQYGPTLPELLAPRWRRASPRTRRMLIAAVALLVAIAAAVAIFFPRDGWIVHHGPPVSFNLRYPRELHRVPAPHGVYARIEQRSGGRLLQFFQIEPLRVGAYRGEISGVLPVYAGNYVAALAARTPGFRLQSEGKTRVNTTPGYSITYSASPQGELVYGRVVMLLPDITRVRDGVLLVMQTVPTAQVTGPDQVAVNGSLQEPLRTFRFGT